MINDLIKRASALIYIRVVLITILLGSLYAFRIGYDKLQHPLAFSFFIASIYFLTIIYALVLRKITTGPRFVVFVYAQIIVDVIAETGLLYLTGGIASMFSFMFPLSILSAGIVLNRRACYIIATLSSILYGLLLDLQLYKIIPSSAIDFFTEKDFFYNIFAHMVAFYLVAFLSGYLSEKLHRATQTLEERDTVLSDLKAFSEYIIESMPSGVFTTDLNRRIITFNTSAQDITRLDGQSVIGRTPYEIFPFLRDLQEPLDRIEGEMQRDGKAVSVGMRLSTLRDSAGNAIGMIGVFQDLTELKAMEAEVKRKEKWAFIGELSASIAHELRNPLASLKGSVEMLYEKKVSEEHADHLMKIALSEMDRLNGIITDFLLYARPQEMKKMSFDLHETLGNVITLLRSSETFDHEVEINAELNGSMPVNGDAKKLQQVFWNLCLNAMDAVAGGGSINISTCRENGITEIVFSDTGSGIEKDEINHIFYPFFTTKEQGTGLGLAIAQKIVEEHGGKISAESDGRGTGSTFRVILPIDKV